MILASGGMEFQVLMVEGKKEFWKRERLAWKG